MYNIYYIYIFIYPGAGAEVAAAAGREVWLPAWAMGPAMGPWQFNHTMEGMGPWGFLKKESLGRNVQFVPKNVPKCTQLYKNLM
jgi:hypothetical protein